MVKGTVSKDRAYAPAIDVLAGASNGFVHLFFSVLHGLNDCGLLLGRESVEVELLSGSNADSSELGTNLLLLRHWRTELQGKAQIVKETGLDHFFVELRKIDGRRRGRGRFP